MEEPKLAWVTEGPTESAKSKSLSVENKPPRFFTSTRRKHLLATRWLFLAVCIFLCLLFFALFLALLILNFLQIQEFKTWLQKKIESEDPDLVNKVTTGLDALVWVSIVFFALLSLVHVLGFVSIVTSRKRLLMLFLALESVTFLILLIGLVSALYIVEQLKEPHGAVTKSVTTVIFQFLYLRSKSSEQSSALALMDEIHGQFDCCGLNNTADWWLRSTYTFAGTRNGEETSISIPAAWLAACFNQTKALCYAPRSCCQDLPEKPPNCTRSSLTLNEALRAGNTRPVPITAMSLQQLDDFMDKHQARITPAYPTKIRTEGCLVAVRRRLSHYLKMISLTFGLVALAVLLALTIGIVLYRLFFSEETPVISIVAPAQK